MEIYLGKRGVRQIREAAHEAIEDGEIEALREEILDAFSEDDVKAIEKILDGEDLYDFISAMLDDWGGDDLDELFELLESQFAEIGVDLTTEYAGDVDDTEVLEDEDDFPVADETDEEFEATEDEGGLEESDDDPGEETEEEDEGGVDEDL